MSYPAFPGDPDEFLPRHISGRIVVDPYEGFRTPRRVACEVGFDELRFDDTVIDLVAIEAQETDRPSLGLAAACDAYEQAQQLATDSVGVPRYELEVCDEGHLHRNAIVPGSPA